MNLQVLHFCENCPFHPLQELLLFTSYTGMADFQVLPPGLSKVTHNNVMLDPMALQLSGTIITLSCMSAYQISSLALLENSSIVQDVPSFLPPGSFLRSDKPSNYSLVYNTHSIPLCLFL